MFPSGDVKDCTTNQDTISSKESRIYSAVRVRSQIETPVTYDKFPTLRSMPPSMYTEYNQLIDKPFYIGSTSWTTSNVSFSTLGRVSIPSTVSANTLASIPFRVAQKYRMQACVLFQVMGTPQHQGTLVAASLPSVAPEFTRNSMNSFMQAPHVFLSANEATPVCLEVPFYSNTKLQNTNLDGNSGRYQMSTDYADVVIGVLNPLSTGGTTTVTISMHLIFKSAEFYVPKNPDIEWTAQSFEVTEKDAWCCLSRSCCTCCLSYFCKCLTTEVADFVAQGSIVPVSTISRVLDNVTKGIKNITGDFIDNVRGAIRSYTGLHNPNIATPDGRKIISLRNFPNNVDVPVFYEKLDTFVDHDRIVSDPVFYTEKDEMLISNIIEKPQYVSTFSLTTSNSVGTVLFSRPITPMQESISSSGGVISTPLQLFSSMSMYWKGSLNIHIQSAMTNFHCCKLLFVRNYSSDKRALVSTPTLTSVTNLMSESMEFSAGGQIQTVKLPFCSELNQIQTAKDFVTNALSHGIYYIYLLNPLVVSSSTIPTMVHFNVYVSANDDFQFYGLSTQLMSPVAFTYPLSVSSANELRLERKLDNVVKGAIQNTTEQDDSKKLKEVARKAKILRVKEESIKKSVDRLVAKLSTSYSTEQVDVLKGTLVKDVDKIFGTFVGQAETLVKPSEQDPILNSTENTIGRFDASDFHPIVSVRDYIRRFTGCQKVVLQSSDFQDAGVFVIPVIDLLRQGVDGQNFQAFNKLVRCFYRGAVGGIKVKLVVHNAKEAVVRYLPPAYRVTTSPTSGVASIYEVTGVVSNTTAVNKAILEQLSYPLSTLSVFGADPSPLPFIEMSPIHKLVGVEGLTSTDPAGVKSTSLNQLLYEFTVPFNNAMDFVGDSTLLSNILSDAYAEGLGNIIVSANIWDLNDAALATSPWVQPYIAYTDETRFGFNVYSPSAQYYTTLIGSTFYVSDPFVGTDTAPIPFGIVGATAAYIG